MEYIKLQYQNAVPSYLENTVFKRPFYHTELKSNLETIVFREKPANEKDLLGRVFSDKTKSQKATVKALFDEITLREYLNLHLLYRINQDICKQNTHFDNLNNLKAYYSIDLFMDLKNKKMHLEENVLELEKEKRKEYLECWRDLMFLKKYLFSALKDYWDLSKRRNTLLGDLNSLTENENIKRY